ncbi:MFS transporter [Pelomonas sp. KK5]|uniref:MFS transporter n=1 Tax=Pelomonas sp. KK5 TaxID=1855730 RepID=UPI00097C9D45|nr:MFS transporter [Pelomonas sp. KK5]
MLPDRLKSFFVDNRISLIVAAAFFMETLDGSIIVTALPAIAHSFGEATLALSVAISAYMIALAVFVPAAGWASERYGARRVFASAVAVFTIASLLCGLSPNFWSFIAARVLQGSAAAFMSPVGRLVVLRETPKHRLIESLGLIVWPALIGPVVGPPLGGLIATYASWHWIFFLNLPIGALGLWLVLRYVPAHEPADESKQRFDVYGFAITSLALVTLLQGLAFIAESPAQRWAGLALVVAGLVVGALAVRHAQRHPAPILNLQSAREPTFVMSTLAAGFWGRVAINTAPFLLPLMFQIGFADNALRAGLMLLVYMAGNLAMKAATTWMLKQHGFRRVLVYNGYAHAATLLGCALMGPGWPLPVICVVLVLAGMTRSMHFTALNTIAFADIPASARGGATTLSAVSSQVAAALAVAFATLALALAQRIAGGEGLQLRDFQIAFGISAALMAGASLWMMRLAHDAGASVTARA